MKLFLKALAVVVAVPVIAMAGAFTYGMYLGFTEVAEYDDMVAEFETYMAELDHCSEIDSEDIFLATPTCQDICESFFECRSIALEGEWELTQASQALYEDTYTEEEYVDTYGPVDLADTVSNPGNSPKPILE